MKLITKEQEAKLQMAYIKDASGDTAMVHLKLFALASSWTFYAIQQDPCNPDRLFGLWFGDGTWLCLNGRNKTAILHGDSSHRARPLFQSRFDGRVEKQAGRRLPLLTERG